jgi:hypothetical protein
LDKRTINLLHWLRFRLLVNAVRHALSSLLGKLGAIGLCLLIVFFLMAFAVAVSYADPWAYLARSHEPWGLLMFIIIALFAAAVAGSNLTLGMHEEDILLVIPAKVETIVQGRMIRTLAVIPLAVFVTTILILGGLSLFIRIDILERLPFAYASVLLFVLICLGFFWIQTGYSAKHPRNDEYAVLLTLIGSLIWIPPFLWLVSQGLEVVVGVWELTYNHPAFRFILAVPLASVDVFLYGSLNLRTGAELLLLLLIAVVMVSLAFRYEYGVFERRVLPYQATLGRGTERESPPLYEWLDRLRKALHIRLPDVGTGSRAVLALAYTKKAPLAFGMGLLLSWFFVPFHLFPISSGVVLLFYLMIIIPLGTLMPWVFGVSMAPTVLSRSNVDILRMVPDEGKRTFKSLLLPELIIMGGWYFGLVAFGAIAWPTPLTPYFLLSSLFPAVYFMIGYVTGASMAISMATSGSGPELEGVPIVLNILPVLPVMIVPVALMSHSIVMLSYLRVIEPVHVVVPLFAITAFGIVSTYLYYLKGCRDLDALRPPRRRRLGLSRR